MVGKSLAHYQILEKIGEGGMGVVYKARDTRLNRFAAIKILPPGKASDPDRKRRFVQEAQSASALSHPNIITIYDIGYEEGLDFIVMEYLPGRTLDQLIPGHGLRLNELLKYAAQIADALTKAHAAGIIHRDLKPSNIMVTEDGLVKVLDFGLAKLSQTPEDSHEQATRTVRTETRDGSIVGTASYMSPEQAEGKPADARSDIFSFGAVLYEMATGQRAFRGDSSMSTLAAILNKDPKNASEIAPAVPRDLEKIINRCLRKDPERRFQYMADLKVALLELKEESESGTLGPPIALKRSNRRRLWWAAALAALIAVAVATPWLFRRLTPPPEPALTSVPLTSFAGSESMPNFSPDGNQVAFVWDGEKQDNRDIWVKLIGPGTPLRLTTDAAPDFDPAWSPDGGSIAFLRAQGETAELRLVPALGGPERKLADVQRTCLPGFISTPDVAWSPDGQWIAFPEAGSPGEGCGVVALSMKTGEKRRLTSPGEASSTDNGIAFSPDGRALAFVRTTNLRAHLYVVPLSADLHPAGEPRLLPSGNSASNALSPAWTVDGQEIVYAGYDQSLNSRGLWHVGVSGSREPQRLAWVGDNSDEPAISRQGRRLAYTAAVGDANVWRLELSGRRETAPPVRLISSTQYEGNAQYSPDGKKVVFASNRSGNIEVWVCEADGSNAIQLTSLGAQSGTPRWSPDGRQIVFDSNKEGRYQIYAMDARGGVPRRLTDNPADDAAPSFSRDGKRIYFSSLRTGRWEVWAMPAEGGEPAQLTRNGGFSPFESTDGRLIYYQKTQGPRSAIWKVPVEGGEEAKVIESVGFRQFAVVAGGIYCIRTDALGQRLEFFDFATRATEDLANLGSPTSLGLTVSPDGRYVLYTQGDQVGSDLMLVENFR
jgi:Tol biopolymer transport system component/predicted Ser/Thr protein kinase